MRKCARKMMKLAIVATAMAGFAPPALAANASGTPADTIHPQIHTKVGQGAGDNANANPVDANDNGGQVHGIANVPGLNDDYNKNARDLP